MENSALATVARAEQAFDYAAATLALGFIATARAAARTGAALYAAAGFAAIGASYARQFEEEAAWRGFLPG